MVYLAMFSTTIDKTTCFWVLITRKLVIIFQSLIPSGTWDFFDFLNSVDKVIASSWIVESLSLTYLICSRKWKYYNILTCLI